MKRPTARGLPLTQFALLHMDALPAPAVLRYDIYLLQVVEL